MARRKARIPQGKKLQPAVKTLSFNFQQGGATGINDYIDLSQCASLVNRRFYRQGLNWAVAGFTFITSGGSGNIYIEKVPDTWVASNAWEKGFHAWNDMNNEALESTESIKPKFTDFKVYMDSVHHAAGVGSNLIPVDEAGTPYVLGTWDMSEMTIPTSGATGNATDFEIIWTGASYPGAAPGSGLDAVSLIEGYASSRGLPEIRDPNAPADAADVGPTGTPENWIGALDNEGTDQDKDVLANMLGDNTEAPYPFENGPDPAGGVLADTQYPGGANQAPTPEIHDVVGVSATTIGNVTKMSGGNFQGGLIKMFNNLAGGSGTSETLLVHLVPGPHRGYMCQKMQDV
jgi:hypothetical protein